MWRVDVGSVSAYSRHGILVPLTDQSCEQSKKKVGRERGRMWGRRSRLPCHGLGCRAIGNTLRTPVLPCMSFSSFRASYCPARPLLRRRGNLSDVMRRRLQNKTPPLLLLASGRITHSSWSETTSSSPPDTLIPPPSAPFSNRNAVVAPLTASSIATWPRPIAAGIKSSCPRMWPPSRELGLVSPRFKLKILPDKVRQSKKGKLHSNLGSP